MPKGPSASRAGSASASSTASEQPSQGRPLRRRGTGVPRGSGNRRTEGRACAARSPAFQGIQPKVRPAHIGCPGWTVTSAMRRTGRRGTHSSAAQRVWRPVSGSQGWPSCASMTRLAEQGPVTGRCRACQQESHAVLSCQRRAASLSAMPQHAYGWWQVNGPVAAEREQAGCIRGLVRLTPTRRA